MKEKNMKKKNKVGRKLSKSIRDQIRSAVRGGSSVESIVGKFGVSAATARRYGARSRGAMPRGRVPLSMTNLASEIKRNQLRLVDVALPMLKRSAVLRAESDHVRTTMVGRVACIVFDVDHADLASAINAVGRLFAQVGAEVRPSGLSVSR